MVGYNDLKGILQTKLFYEFMILQSRWSLLIQAAGVYQTLEDPKGGSNLFSYYRNHSENHQDNTERQPLYTVFSSKLK